ncbi:hypothetical protein ACJZ2D_010046 [Fusarium nematophilum]
MEYHPFRLPPVWPSAIYEETRRGRGCRSDYRVSGNASSAVMAAELLARRRGPDVRLQGCLSRIPAVDIVNNQVMASGKRVGSARQDVAEFSVLFLAHTCAGKTDDRLTIRVAQLAIPTNRPGCGWLSTCRLAHVSQPPAKRQRHAMAPGQKKGDS